MIYRFCSAGEDAENRDNPFWEQLCIVVNALDGSIVNPDNGQQALRSEGGFSSGESA